MESIVNNEDKRKAKKILSNMMKSYYRCPGCKDKISFIPPKLLARAISGSILECQNCHSNIEFNRDLENFILVDDDELEEDFEGEEADEYGRS